MAPVGRGPRRCKLSDPTGGNVWWYHRDAFDPPAERHTLRIESRQIEFAWGPAGGGAPARIGAVELAIAAGPGGSGTIWIADLHLEDLDLRVPARLSASSAQPGHPPEHAIDGSWRSAGDGPQWLHLDLQGERDVGGLVVRWEPGRHATHFRVQTSNDGAEVSLAGDLAVPPRAIEIRPPLPRPLRRVEVDGRAVETFDAERVAVPRCPAEVVMRW